MPEVVFVTGVDGFIGRYVAGHFSKQGWSVVGIDNVPAENAPLSSLSAYHRLQLPASELGELLREYSPRVCIHCAGRASVGLSISDPAADFYSSSVLTFEILNSLLKHAPSCRFIFLSSAAVYGNPSVLPVNETQPLAPLSPYGFHKLQCEQLCLEFAEVYKLPTASVRIFSAYGPGLRRQVLWDICQKAIAQNSLVLQGSGHESRDFIHGLDIARALSVVAGSAPMRGEVYNLGTGREVSIRELAELTLDALGCDFVPQFDGIVPAGNPLNWRADISKIRELGFSPSISLEQGVKAFSTWCQAELRGL